ncbi:uncharacterized protein LOC119676070 [Teleopsis dalmanni]|uniref:uncharacterized protein LOC119676070 n=1 Tax=Teleopsis dalmanni TaxID=139649 RepID=UPI0018CF9F62|nr:uncharacterized protein LOC119676070 [Teleopsis dalmanni]
MSSIVLLLTVVVSAIAAPQGYNYKSSAPVVEHGNLNGFKPILASGLPCSHNANNNLGEINGNAAALIQSQSTGRIVNHHNGQHHVEHNLDTAASTVNSQSQAVTVNSHIRVGDNGPAASVITGASQEFRPIAGYVQGGLAEQSSSTASISQQLLPLPQQQNYFNPLPQLPPQLPAQPFNSAQTNSAQNFAYTNTFTNQAASTQANHIHHHYTVPSSGKVQLPPAPAPAPPPLVPAPAPVYLPPQSTPGLQYASGYESNKFAATQNTGFTGRPSRPLTQFISSSPYRPLGPVLPGPVGNVAVPRPVQHFGGSNQFSSSNSYQQSSNGYASSFGHNSFGAQVISPNNNFAPQQPQHLISAGNAASFGTGSFGGHNIDFSSSSSNQLNGQLGNVIRETFANAPLDPTFEKHIYVHVPPEDLEGSKHAPVQLIQQEQPKKHYKIIFIKAPNSATPNYAQLAAATAPQSEEKTIVYVLVKKPEEPTVEEIQQIQQSSIHSSKPEVYFIKYKTRKEGEQLGPVYDGATQYNNVNQISSSNGASNVATNSNAVLAPEDNIDIRYGGGESNSYSTSSSSLTSTSSSSSASSTLDDSVTQHGLYGVPLE